MSRTILYYPEINITNEGWLKNAVLYWDKVSSIVPYEGYIDKMSQMIKYLKSIGVYRAVYPHTLFNLDYRDECSEFIEEFTRECRKKVYLSVANTKNSKQKYIYTERRKVYVPELSTLMHYNKIPVGLLEDLKKMNVIQINSDNQWIEMDNNIAVTYMEVLARYLAKIGDDDMIIGSSNNDDVYSLCKRATNRGERNICLSSIIEKALPIPRPNVHIEEIIEFKFKRGHELIELRKKLIKFENDLSACQSVEELKSVVQTFKEMWIKELISMETMLKDSKIDFILGNLKSMISISEVGGALAIMDWYSKNVPNNPQWLLAAGIAGIGAIGVGVQFSNYKKTLRQNNESNA